MLAVLGIGGTLVSVKIGGGSNLHNLDAYLILVLIVSAYLITSQIAGLPSRKPGLPLGAAVIASAIPVLFTLTTGAPLRWPDPDRGRAIVEELREEIAGFSSDAKILFLSERHLLTFGQIEGVGLIPDYEKVFLMEMAMGNSRGYLDPFVASLRRGEFDLIISEPMKIQYQGRSRAFGEENDVWVDRVAVPVLCYYEPVKTFEGAPIQLLVARAAAAECAQN
jgi:hypothetical protein